MVTTQDVKYKIVVVKPDALTASLERYFVGGDVINKTSGVPSARLIFTDKNLTLSNDGILDYNDEIYVALSASSDSGVNYSRIFTGRVEDFKRSLDSDGKRTVEITAYDAPELRYNIVTINQIGIGLCDFGQLFTGSPTTSHGTTWASDFRGNYPNGLLYDTGYTYSADSIRNYMADEDFGMRVYYSTNKKLDAIKTWLEPFGAVYVVDTKNHEFGVYSSSNLRRYPTVSNYLDVGINVSRYDERYDMSPVTDMVTLVGSNNNIFFIEGTGSIHDLYLNKDFASYKMAQKGALEYLSQSANRKSEFAVDILPDNTTYVGKSIILRELDLAFYRTLSIDEQRHSFEADRWSTRIVGNQQKLTEPVSIANLMSEIQKLKEDNTDLSGIAYLRASSGESTFSMNDGADCDNVCAIGFGTSSALSTHSGLDGPIIIKRVSTAYPYGVGIMHAFASLGPNEGNGHIRNIVVFANTGSNYEPLTASETTSWGERPSTEWNTDNSATVMYPIHTTSNRYLITLDSVRIVSTFSGCITYPLNLLDSKMMLVNDAPPTHVPLAFDSEVDDVSEWAIRGYYISSTDASKMANDAKMTDPTFSTVVLRNIAEDGTSTGYPVQLLIELGLPGDPVDQMRYIAKQIRFMMTIRTSYSHAEGTGTAPWRLYAWKSASADEWAWADIIPGNMNQSTSNNLFFNNIRIGPGATYASPLPFIDGSGKMRFLVVATNSFVGTGEEPIDNVTLSMRIGYIGCTVDVKEHRDDITDDDLMRFERCSVDFYTGRFKTTHPMDTIYALYASATDNGDNGYTPIEDAYNMMQHDTVIDKTAPTVFKYGYRKPSWWTDGFTAYASRIALGGNGLVYSQWINPIDDNDMAVAFCKIHDSGVLYIKYRREFINPNTPPAETVFEIMPSEMSSSFVAGTYASQSVIYIDHNKLPPHGCNIVFDGSFVGDNASTPAHGGAIGKTTFNQLSSLREGVDKNMYKSLYVQYNLGMDVLANGDIFSIGGGGGTFHPI